MTDQWPSQPSYPPISAVPVSGGVASAARLMHIGDFVAGPEWVQAAGQTLPIAGTTWRFNESMAYRSSIPTVAIVLAIVLIPCTGFLSLLFLLMKEQKVGGLVVVELTYRSMTLSTQIPVDSFPALDNIRRSVAQAQAWGLAGWSASSRH